MTLKDMIFGKRLERLAAIVAEQFALELGDLETSGTPPVAANDDAPTAKPAGRPRKTARRNIGALPKHLPRCEQVLEPGTTACPCCQGELHQIGEDVSEVLDVIPAILRVLRTIRAKYGCRSCTDGVVHAKVLPRLIENGMASTALVSHCTVARRHNDISRILSTTPDRFEPMHRRKSNGEVDPRPWCRGFYAAMRLRTFRFRQHQCPSHAPPWRHWRAP
jgi:hypothetical protein